MIGVHKKILICIFAVFDEEPVIDILNKIPKSLANFEHEILVLIDGSRDLYFQKVMKTVEALKLFNAQVLFTSEKLGYGGNQKLAFYYAIKHEFEMVISLDGSGQYPPENLEKFLFGMENSEVQAFVGSRFLEKGNGRQHKMSFYRFLGNKTVTFLQNLILDLNFSEFHSGFRAFRVKALEKTPFSFNSNGRKFDIEILIQFKLIGFPIKELPVSYVEGDKKGVMECFRYGMDALKLSLKYRLHKMALFYERKFDVSTGFKKYTLKKGYPSSHQFALDEVKNNSRVIDIGCGNSLIGEELTSLGCSVEAIDCENPEGLSRINKFTNMNLNDENINIPIHDFDYVLLLDVLEHLEKPENFILNLRIHACGASPKIIISVPNIGFFAMRLSLFFGWFNYGVRGILDMGHRRLFTFNTIKKMLKDAGFEILICKGVPGPYPEAIGYNWLSRSLLCVNRWLVKIFPMLFSYQIFMVVVPLPTLDFLLERSRMAEK